MERLRSESDDERDPEARVSSSRDEDDADGKEGWQDVVAECQVESGQRFFVEWAGGQSFSVVEVETVYKDGGADAADLFDDEHAPKEAVD